LCFRGWFFLLWFFLVFVGAEPSPCRGPGGPFPDLPVGAEVGKLAPDFTLRDLSSGEPVSLSPLRGCVVLLEFWASWCPACRSSIPYLEGLAAPYRDRGLVTVGVSLDREAERAAGFLSALGVRGDMALWGPLARVLGVVRLYHVGAIPWVFLLDREGVVRFSGHPSKLSTGLIEPWLGS